MHNGEEHSVPSEAREVQNAPRLMHSVLRAD
jgi:hypothetical protein